MTIEATWSLGYAEPTAAIYAGDLTTNGTDLGAYCRYVRMVAPAVSAGAYYYPLASPDGVLPFNRVYINSTLQQGAANALYIVFEIGFARYVQIGVSAVQGVDRIITLRGYSF